MSVAHLKDWQVFVRCYGPRIASRCRHVGIPADETDDVIQDVFLRVHRGLLSFQPNDRPGCFEAWVKRLIQSAIADYFRTPARRRQVRGGESGDAVLARFPWPTHAEEQDSSAPCPELDMLQLITDEFGIKGATILWLAVVEERPSREIAEELSMTAGSVRTFKSRILKWLRDLHGGGRKE